MVWFWAILGILAILLTGSYFCAQAAFRVPKNLEKYLYKLPNTPQYSPYAKQVREMIDKALAIPYEDVWTTSQDGLRLHGHGHHGLLIAAQQRHQTLGAALPDVQM